MKFFKCAFATLAIASTFFAACKKEMKPEAVVTSFLQAMNNASFEDAKQYCTNEFSSTIALISKFASESQAASPKISFDIRSLEVGEDGKTAAVLTRLSPYGQAAKQATVKLEKKANCWAIAAADELVALYSDSYPQITVLKFHQELAKLNFDEAKKYCTKEGASMIEIARGYVTPEKYEEIRERGKGYTTEILSLAISEDETMAYAEVKVSQGGRTSKDVMELKKEDGRWKVVFKK